MKTENNNSKQSTEKEIEKKQNSDQQTASDSRITNERILRKYGLSESVNPQILME